MVRESRRSRGDRPEGRRDPRARLVPDLRPGRLHAAQEERARAARSTRTSPRPRTSRRSTAQSRARTRPGSTFKPVTALAAMQEHILAPYDSLPCTGSYEVAGQTLQQLGPGRERDDDAADRARPVLRHVLLPTRQGLLRPAARAAASRSRSGRRRFGFGQPTGIDVGPEASGLAADDRRGSERPSRRRPTPRWQIDRIWKPGDSIQLAIGQKDLLVTPLQMARFYALLANGGKLVKPHLVPAIEQGGGSTTGPAPGSPIVLRRYQPPRRS